MLRTVARWIPVALVAWGCATPGHLPPQLHHAPGHQPKVAQRLAGARRQFLRGNSGAALAAVEALLKEHPGHVNSERLRQDILRQRGRLGRVLFEAEQRLAARPDDASAHYLAGRVADDDAEKRVAFQRAVALDPQNFWGWFGLAFVERRTDNEAANRIYAELFARTGAMRVGVAYAASLRLGNREAQAFQVYDRLEKTHPGMSALGKGESLLRSGKHSQAGRFVRRALELRPYDGGTQQLVANYLARGQTDNELQELLDLLRADPDRSEAFGRGAPALLASMFQRVGEPHAALDVLQQQPRLNPEEARLRRQLLLACVGVDAYLRALRDSVFAPFLADEENQVRDRWQALLGGAWMEARDPIADAGMATGLVSALLRVGELKAADQVATIALLRHGREENALTTLRREARREIAFESAVRRLFANGYGSFLVSQERGDLDGFLDELRTISKRLLGEDVVGEPKRFELPFVGTLIDSLGPGLPAHFARYNKHLVMGQRAGRPIEGMILTRLSMRYVDPVAEVPMPARSIEVVGDHRELQPLEQADLAGIALLNHYVVDMDEVRNWAATIAERRRVSAADGNAVLRDPLPEGLPANRPGSAAWRLSLLSPVEDKDLDEAVLDIIRWHERGHMVDFEHLLPIELHPVRSIALTLRNGLSALGVASEMEGRAELVALAMSPHTRLVAAHIAGFLSGDGGSSPHAHGFRDLVDALIEELERQGVENREVQRWHLLDPEILRHAGKALMRRLW